MSKIVSISKKMNLPETILSANEKGIAMLPNSWYDKGILSGALEKYKGIPLPTNDICIYGRNGHAMDGEIVLPFKFNGDDKYFIYLASENKRIPRGKMLLAKQGFAGREPLNIITDAQGREIKDLDKLGEQDRVFFKIRGPLVEAPLGDRRSAKFIGEEKAEYSLSTSNEPNISFFFRYVSEYLNGMISADMAPGANFASIGQLIFGK